MNYLQELNAFRDWSLLNHPSTGQVALWYSLMSINNMAGWQEWFTVANQTLQLMSGMSKAGLDKARTQLINKGLIQYKPGTTRQAGKYKLVSIYDKKVVQWENNQETNSLPIGEQWENNQETINKQEKKKKIPKSDPAKNQYAERVWLTPEEYQKLIDKFGEVDALDRIERLSLYKQSTGKKYDSDYATILNWARKDEKNPSATNKVVGLSTFSKKQNNSADDYDPLGRNATILGD